MTETIRKQILAIRDTGLTNMFDLNMVQRAFLQPEHQLFILQAAAVGVEPGDDPELIGITHQFRTRQS